MEFELKEGLFNDISSEEYHTISGSYSSSQLKDILEDPELFHAKYIAKTIARKTMSAFDIGTYFHTWVLEPEKLDIECCVYEGKRIGKNWDAFKAHNMKKTIITKTELLVAKGLVDVVLNSPIAAGRLKRGTPEVSCFLKVRVWHGDIYAITWKKVLGRYGWEDTVVPAKGVDIWLKVRADWLGESFVLDLKSTRGNAKNERAMRNKVSELNYDLSAALYLDIFSAAKQKKMSEFVWTFASKDFFNCKSYIASTDNISIGRAKWKLAVLALADGMEFDWEVPDSMGILEPNQYEYEFIKEKASDIL